MRSTFLTQNTQDYDNFQKNSGDPGSHSWEELPCPAPSRIPDYAFWPPIFSTLHRHWQVGDIQNLSLFTVFLTPSWTPSTLCQCHTLSHVWIHPSETVTVAQHSLPLRRDVTRQFNVRSKLANCQSSAQDNVRWSETLSTDGNRWFQWCWDGRFHKLL